MARNRTANNRPSEVPKDISNYNSQNLVPTPDDHLRPNEEYGINSHFKASYSYASSPRISYRAQAIKKAEKGRFLSLGYGLVAYFDTLSSFIKLFALYSVLSLISLALISVLFDSPKHNSTFTANHSLGHLGQSEPLCVQTELGVKNVNIKCPSGLISKVHKFGIIDKAEIELKNQQDMQAKQMSFFSPREKGQRCISRSTDVCRGVLNYLKLMDFLESECIGEKACRITNLTEAYTQSVGLSYKQCLSEESLFFVQVSCQEPAFTLAKKKLFGLVSALIVCFQGLYFFYTLKRMKESSSQEFEKVNDLCVYNWSIVGQRHSDHK